MCSETIQCGQPPNVTDDGYRTWIKDGYYGDYYDYYEDLVDDYYEAEVEYGCVNGSQFDTDGDGYGNAYRIVDTCMWNKTWTPYPELPDCKITHCVDPFAIPSDTMLEEETHNTISWTSVGNKKTYRCQGILNDGTHTMFFEHDRSLSEFEMHCLPDGTFDFDNKTENWPICLEDILCALPPPEIPTNTEYTLGKDDGKVVIHSLEYPSLIKTANWELNSTYNSTDIPQNYMANLTYFCGSARMFLAENGNHSESQSMTCLWDRNWTASLDGLECDWVACLKPAAPPLSTNLRVTHWDGEPIPFGGKARYVCNRGTQFEDDPYQKSVEYECQDTTEEALTRGFFNVPEKEEDWPRCLYAPLCPKPPEPPFEGKQENFPSVHPMIEEEVCNVDWQPLSLQCSSFEIIQVTQAIYGRKKFNKELCNGDEDSKQVEQDCLEDLTELFGSYCQGKYNCTFPILPTIHDWMGDCFAGQKNELTISYICVECAEWHLGVDSDDCIDSAFLGNRWMAAEELQYLSETDKKTKLMESLHKHLNSSLHPIPDLSLTDVVLAKGGQCGMAAMYRALYSTVLTKTMLSTMSYSHMRSRLFAEMGKEENKWKDKVLLKEYYEYMCPTISTSALPGTGNATSADAAARKKRSVGTSHIRTIRAVETEEEIEYRSYGANLRYQCGLARKFLDPESGLTYDERWIHCNWNNTWTKHDTLDECVWVQCINPPEAPDEANLLSTWTGEPVEFNSSVSYVCNSPERFFEIDRDQGEWNLTCLSDGSWAVPDTWPLCLESVNCTDPPDRPPAGTWEWQNEFAYESQASYTCGPFGKFKSVTGEIYEEVISECAWNKTWVPSELDLCEATFCQAVPFPPKDIGMVYSPDEKNNMSFASELAKYNPNIPLTMRFPGVDFCGEFDQKLLVVGKVLEENSEKPEIVFHGHDGEEAFHVYLDIENKFIDRWGVFNGEESKKEGTQGEGTTINFVEPFVLTVRCDGDGWVLQVNDEIQYPHFYHKVPLKNITHVDFTGDVEFNYVGFGGPDQQPAPAVGFNLTFSCPDGMVFNHDWFATPFVMMTCQGNGVFDQPDWDIYQCVLPTTTECFDCTTTTPPNQSNS